MKRLPSLLLPAALLILPGNAAPPIDPKPSSDPNGASVDPAFRSQELPTKVSLEDATVELSLTGDGAFGLQEALNVVIEQLPSPPSIIYKPGAETLQVPAMEVQDVRFADLLAALEELLPLRFTIRNPSPEPGQRSLLIVESAGPAVLRTQSAPSPHPGSLPSGFGPSPAPGSSGAGGEDGGSGAPLHPTGALPPPPADPFAPPSDPNPLMAAGWGGSGATPPATLTRTFAIGSLLTEEGTTTPDNIIDAINLVWSTAGLPEPTGKKDAPRLAFHAPSSLLIIKAPQPWQALAEDVISKLLESQEIGQRRHVDQSEAKLREEQAQREAEHRERLNEILLERLKASHATEVDKLLSKVQDLESQLSALQARLKAGG